MSMIERHFSCPTVYLSWSFVLTRCCVTAWVMKMLVLAGLTIHTRRIWPESRRFTTPADVLNFPCWEVSNGKTEFSKTGQSHHFCCWFCRRWQSKFELVLVIKYVSWCASYRTYHRSLGKLLFRKEYASTRWCYTQKNACALHLHLAPALLVLRMANIKPGW